MALVLREHRGEGDALIAAQALRYAVYHRDLGLDTPDMDHARRLDIETNDPICDFLAVIDDATGALVGTLRLQTSGSQRLYAELEFDLLDPWFRARTFVEGARFAVLSDHRNGAAALMLYDGFRRYCHARNIHDLIGVAIVSDPRFDPDVGRALYHWITARTPRALDRARPAAGYEPTGWDEGPSAHALELARIPPMLRLLARPRSTLCSIPAYCRRFRTWNFLLTTRLGLEVTP